jgi:hypothetical protein
MTILPADLPDDARQAVLDGMRKRARTRGFWTPKLGHAHRAHCETLQLCAPHRVALLPLSKMRHGSRHKTFAGKVPSDVARPSLSSVAGILGWRFLIFEPDDMDKPIAAAHAVLTAEGDYRLGELNEGPYVDSTLIALQTPLVREAISSKNDESTFCEPLLLLAPAIYFAGLWIRFQHAEQDFILPMDSNHLPGFVAVKPEALLALLRCESTKVLTDSASAG